MILIEWIYFYRINWNYEWSQSEKSSGRCPRITMVSSDNANKSDNFTREIEVGQINVNKSDDFSREIEVGETNLYY